MLFLLQEKQILSAFRLWFLNEHQDILEEHHCLMKLEESHDKSYLLDLSNEHSLLLQLVFLILPLGELSFE